MKYENNNKEEKIKNYNKPPKSKNRRNFQTGTSSNRKKDEEK